MLTVIVIPILTEFSPETFLQIMLELWLETEPIVENNTADESPNKPPAAENVAENNTEVIDNNN
jgi:hypothetical protein